MVNEIENFRIGQVAQHRQMEAHSNDAVLETQRVQGFKPDPEHWLYCRVLETLPQGQVRIVVDHPGNRENGLEKIVPESELRTSADIQPLIIAQKSAVEKNPTQGNKSKYAGLVHQFERLQESEEQVAAKAAPTQKEGSGESTEADPSVAPPAA